MFGTIILLHVLNEGKDKVRIKDNFTHTVRGMEGFDDFIAEAIFREMIWGQFYTTRGPGPRWRLSKKRVQSARGLWCIFPQ